MSNSTEGTTNQPSALTQTLLYGFSIALMKGVSLLMLPFVAHHLTPTEFGRLEVISSLALVGSVMVGMGLEHTLYRFSGTCTCDIKQKSVAAQIFCIALIIGITSLVASHTLAPSIAALLPGHVTPYEVLLILAMLSFEGIIAIPLAWLRMKGKAGTFFVITTGRAILHATLTIVALNNNGGVSEILEAGLIAALVQTVILFYLQYKTVGIAFSLATTKTTLIYSLPIVGSGLVAFSLNGFDRWILAKEALLLDVALFGVAAKFSLAVVLLMQPFTMWWNPKRFQVLHEKDGKKKISRFIALGTVLILSIGVFVSFMAPIIIITTLPETYNQAASFTIGLVISMMFRELAELYNIGCFTGTTTRLQFFINIIGATIGLCGMIILTPIHGVWGVITSLAVAHLFRLIAFIFASQRFLPLNLPSNDLFSFLILSIAWMAFSTIVYSLSLQVLFAIAALSSLTFASFILNLLPPLKILRTTK